MAVREGALAAAARLQRSYVDFTEAGEYLRRASGEGDVVEAARLYVVHRRAHQTAVEKAERALRGVEAA